MIESNKKTLPKVTIITICYNVESEIEATLKSVYHQTYANYEYLIIDGNSKDRSLEIIRSYQTKFALKGVKLQIISEPDKGIYDAMNKGIRLASGHWINFMNAGDRFDNKHVIQRIFQTPQKDAILYGDTIYKMCFGDLLLKPKNLSALKERMSFCHQSVFMPTAWLKAKPFSLKYRIASDYKMFHDHFIKGTPFRYIPLTISVFESEEGISNMNPLLGFKERQAIREKDRGVGYLLHYSSKFCIFHLKKSLSHVLPPDLVQNIRARNYERQMRRRIAKQRHA